MRNCDYYKDRAALEAAAAKRGIDPLVFAFAEYTLEPLPDWVKPDEWLHDTKDDRVWKIDSIDPMTDGYKISVAVGPNVVASLRFTDTLRPDQFGTEFKHIEIKEIKHD